MGPNTESSFGRRREAFTLIELLIVIAIITLLTAILFPTFAAAREKARQSTCVSNERQLGAAILVYAQDYDETYPPANCPAATVSGIANWYYLADPYIKSGIPADVLAQAGITKSILHCPDYDRTAIPGVDYPSRCYGVNRRLMPPVGEATMLPAAYISLPAPLTQVRTPAQTVLLAEVAGDTAWTEGMDDPARVAAAPVAGTPIAATSLSYVRARIRHSDGTEYLLADGHVKWFKAPSPNTLDAAGQIPNRSIDGILYRKSANPSAGGWFYEDVD